MRAPGAIVLLSTYGLGHQPLHLASPLGFLTAAGFLPRALDLSVEMLDEALVKNARLVAIAAQMHTAFRLGVEVARTVRRLNPTAHVCFYGLYAPLNRRFLVDEQLADSVVGGEVEGALVALAEALDRGDSGLGSLGISPVVLEKLTFAVPARSQLPSLKKYARLLHRDGSQLAGHVEATRGCLHMCRHCPIPPVYEGRFFVVQRDVVLADARQQIAAGARHITFGDPDFLNGPGHTMAVARALHAEFPTVTFDITAKIEHLLAHRTLLPELASLGCLFIVSAVESLSERVLLLLDKGHTRADVDAAVDLVRAARITLRPSQLPFTPWSTIEDYGALLDYIVAKDLVEEVDPIQLAIRLLLPPGSKLLALPETQALVGPLSADRLTYVWAHPDARMDALAAQAMKVVEEAAAVEEEPRLTFARLRRLTAAVAAGEPFFESATRGPTMHKPRSPRLSEAWFCCAEPTAGQFGQLAKTTPQV